jgi:hypothetical protein
MLGDQAWLAVRDLCRIVKFFHINLDKPFLKWISLCARGYCHAETGKGLPQTVATMLEETELSRMSLYVVVLIFPYT